MKKGSSEGLKAFIGKPSGKSKLVYYVSAFLLVLLILFLQPALVGGDASPSVPRNRRDTQHCSGNGQLNTTDSSCICYSGYYGFKCALKYCPFGPSWASMPISADNYRYMPSAECSDMGICDQSTGLCDCRPGFTGRACERTECPSSAAPAPFVVISTDPNEYGRSAKATCSGHGLCYTMREAALGFDGLLLSNPPVQYSLWDADMIQGCVCDPGYEGYDCSFRSCPKGPDPQLYSNPATELSSETYVLQCRADDGFFTLQVAGQTTEPIPFNADVGYLKAILQSLNYVNYVEITMSKETDGTPRVCGAASGTFSTYITIKDYVGVRPPIMVSRLTGPTRMWRDGGRKLIYSPGTTVLRMATVMTLTCPVCSSCSGSIYLTYRESMTPKMSVTDTSVISSGMQSYLSALSDLAQAGWTSLSITVSSSRTSICSSSGSTTTTITMYSSYGNIPDLGIIGNVVSDVNGNPITITLTSNRGVGKLYECSNQGICDRSTGQCQCLQGYGSGNLQYRALSSDGKGGRGNNGDCGYIDIPMGSQTAATCRLNGNDLCNGHGFCSNSTLSCLCFDGWKGISCQVKDCPTGAAWFDEAVTTSKAHRTGTECSNMGVCDRSQGVCKCNRGYFGSACQYKDCYRNVNNGEPCSGNGWCLTMRQWAEKAGYIYGGTDASWDADIWHECMCQADVTAGFTGNPTYPTVGPRSVVSGYPAESIPLPGYRGFDCSLRNCPAGDSPSGRNNYASGFMEVQRVVCPLLSTGGEYFHLSFNGHLSKPIYAGYNAPDIKAAIEWPASIGNVSITFPNGDVDFIGTACSQSISYSDGGFAVTFVTHFGDLPILISDRPEVEVYEAQKGTKLSLECSGADSGVCNRKTGVCECYPPYASSDGSFDNPGDRGDCGYNSPYFKSSNGAIK